MFVLSNTGVRRGWSATAALALVGGLLPLVGLDIAPARAASPTETTLVVNKGGDRTGEQTVGPLAGATFDFYAGISDTRPGPGDIPDASCTTDVTGACSVDVPGRTGPDQGYWIIERSAPTGWRLLQELDVGGISTSPTVYNGVFTGAVANDQTYEFPVETTGDANLTARGPIWADARDNPPLPGQCGLHVAFLIDVSGSITGDLPQVKAAANGYVDALTGTPSEIAVYSFATEADAVLNPTPVSDVSGADVVKAAVNGLTAGGTTNWDQGLFQIAAAPFDFDAVIMITDGNPTVYGPPPVQGTGGFTRFIELESGIFSANAVKAEGTRIIVIGVGDGVGGSTNNLSAVSGPVAGSDYYQADTDELGPLLRQLALETCAGTISVVKKVIPFGGTPADAQPAGGWTISTADSGVTPASGVTGDASGAISFDVDLGGDPSRDVTLAETLKPDFTLVQQAGDNASCTANGLPAPVTNSGALGFTVTVSTDAIVSCIILNQAPDPLASVVVNKTWVINGEPFEDPDQDAQFEAALSLTGITEPAWGVEYTDFDAGQTITIAEEINLQLFPPGCDNVASGDLGEQTLASGLNTYQVTNTVTCTTRLRLDKTIDNPYGVPEPPLTAWTLNAFPPGSTDPLFSGTTGTTGEVTPEIIYSLGETNVSGFTQTVVDGAVITPPATGSWDCQLLMRDGSLGGTFDGADGTVAIQIGQTAVCTATNQAQPGNLTLVKEVENPFGGTATPQDWVLNALPPPGSPAAPVTGRSGEPAVTEAEVSPNVGYTLTETDGPQGYEPVGTVQCLLTGTQTPVQTPGNVLTPSFGQDITCTFRNRQLEPPPGEARLTLVKEVENPFGGTAVPRDWLLNATPPPGSGVTPVSGRSGEAAVTDVPATAGVRYTLSETDGPTGYEQLGSVTCVDNATGERISTPDDALTPIDGISYTCTWRNGQVDPGAAHLTLVKKVWHGEAKPTDWTLTATPDNGATPISGTSGSPSVTGVRVQVGVGHKLSESGGPKGYEHVGSPKCVITGTGTTVPVLHGVVTPSNGQNITCTFHNRLKKHLPVTGMKLTGVIGGGLLSMAVGVLLVAWRRRQSVNT
ncbi:VWA domain-containing protein [Micromonospora sp. CNB394]|uniref:VWA domain-containing protein n=1 Tax=Micromonospora sp. CNB394 TaxID=1169151 RepID=UPI0003A29BA4|nr:VWA domain-containing protein [Micromonospora sp. CNB394]